MAVTITMPQLGETVTEGTILAWVKQIGERVAEDDILVEISTDKVDTEVPSPAAGILSEILVGAGETVAVGTAIAILEETADDLRPQTSDDGPETSDDGPEEDAVPVPPSSVPLAAETGEGSEQRESRDRGNGSRGVLSPVVRKLARENNVDVAMVRGTGDGDRVTRKDIEAFIAARGSASESVEAPAPPSTVDPSRDGGSAPSGDPAFPEVREVSRLRSRIAENMAHAKRTAAHVWTSVEVDYERVERVRSRHREAFTSSEGFSLTYLPFIVRATMDALAAFPVVNSTLDLDAGTHTFTRAVHLGVAVDLDQEGLVVPIVRDAESMTLRAVARSIRSVATKARSGQLGPDDFAGSTFTITNPGPYGSHMSVPIINVPNAAILSTETVKKRPVVVEMPDGTDSISIHHIGYLGLSWDHRVFDGSTAVMFLNHIKANLETWDWEQELS